MITLTVQVDVTNIGKLKGQEIVQLYAKIKNVILKQLKNTSRVCQSFIKANETKQLHLH